MEVGTSYCSAGGSDANTGVMDIEIIYCQA